MATVSVHEAETQLAALIDRAASGQEVIIAKEGTPPMKLSPVRSTESGRLGYLKGQYSIPEDIKAPFAAEIEDLFYGDQDKFKDR